MSASVAPNNGDVTAKSKGLKHEQQALNARSYWTDALHFSVCAAGILGCYFAFGIYQEIM